MLIRHPQAAVFNGHKADVITFEQRDYSPRAYTAIIIQPSRPEARLQYADRLPVDTESHLVMN